MTKEREWTAQQWQLIQWWATPRSEREPPTQLELAEEMGRGRSTLQSWQKKAGFWQAVDAQVKKWVGKLAPDILRAMVGKAKLGDKDKMGNVAAARLLLGYGGKYEERVGGGVQIAIIQPMMREAMAEIKGIMNDFIALYVPKADHSNAKGYLAKRVQELGAGVDGGFSVEDGVFRPLLQGTE